MISCHGVYMGPISFYGSKSLMSFFLGQQNVGRVTKAFKYVLYEGTLLKNSTRRLTTVSACERSSPWRSGVPPRELACRVPGAQISAAWHSERGENEGRLERERGKYCHEGKTKRASLLLSLSSLPSFFNPRKFSP